jgi:tRNA pseudouridine55 synthase
MIWVSNWVWGALQSLRRTSLGEFDLRQAHTLEDLRSGGQGRQERGTIHSSSPAAARVSMCNGHGGDGRADSPRARGKSAGAVSARQVKVFAGQRELIAIATRIAGTLFHPKIVLADTQTT